VGGVGSLNVLEIFKDSATHSLPLPRLTPQVGNRDLPLHWASLQSFEALLDRNLSDHQLQKAAPRKRGNEHYTPKANTRYHYISRNSSFLNSVTLMLYGNCLASPENATRSRRSKG
jgi:hypothetical protein